MHIRFFFLLAMLAIAAPCTGLAQKRSTSVVARADTVSLALISTDTVVAEQVESVVRTRHREVQFCFEESGLKTDPDLSGVFAMILTLDTLGAVSRVDASRQEWSGPDGTAVGECVMQRARTWRFPAPLAMTAPRHEVTFHFSK
jgi:hypothetical protein